jgi:hypothetical protein
MSSWRPSTTTDVVRKYCASNTAGVTTPTWKPCQANTRDAGRSVLQLRSLRLRRSKPIRWCGRRSLPAYSR